MRIRNKIIIGVLIILFGTLIALWLLSVSGMVCLTRTGIEPDPRYADSTMMKEEASLLRERIVASLMRIFESDTGLFIYGLSPSGARSKGQNDIRQLLASRVIALEAVNDEYAQQVHMKNLEVIMEKWYREEGGAGYVFVDNKSKLGANAMLLRVLVASPFFTTYESEAENLVFGIGALQNEDGSFEPWFKEPGYEYNKEYLLTFYSGEAILALLEYAEKTGDQLSWNIAKRAQEFYITEYVDKIDENYYPAYVPWHTLSLALFYEKTKEKRYADAIFKMTDKLLEIQDTTNFIGRFYNPETPEYGTPHASSDAVYTEGLSTAYAVAREVGDTVRETHYREALTRAYAHLARLEFVPAWYRIFDDSEAVERLKGGIQTGFCDMQIRVDTSAHTADALEALIRAIK